MTLQELSSSYTDSAESLISSSPSYQVTPGTPLSLGDELFENNFAFVLDIDGVLVRGGKPIPDAVEALRMLNGKNEHGIRVPYILLTNGGGKSEAERCVDLSKQLETEISPAQFICGHTPMSDMVEKYETILVVGGVGENCRKIAEGYGFKDVVTPGDIINEDEYTTPFRSLTKEEKHAARKRDFHRTKIDAIFIFADSGDWAGDCQIILDIAMSTSGWIGTLSETHAEGPPIYFSHNDLVWSTSHQHVRLGMGALRIVIETLYRELTGKTLETITFGKPQVSTFEFAARVLQEWRKMEYNLDSMLETVYFVGDSPESDIQGTNRFNNTSKTEWHSILVCTGIHQSGNDPKYKPKTTVDTVLSAVKYGIEREFEKRKKKGFSDLGWSIATDTNMTSEEI